MADETAEPAEVDGPGAITAVGWLMVLGGVALVVWSFNFDVGVSTTAGGLYGFPERVANADLVARRQMIVTCGAASFVAGWVAVATGMILKALARP